jgi:small subunit ribosomal protein S2
MQEISLQELLEAGSHFGHKSERWNPGAQEFIYTEKDGIHIIDLAKTKAGIEAARTFIRDLVAGGSEILFVATKRQARSILKDAAEKVSAPYFTQRWVGGFLTNWDNIKKNIDKANTMTVEKATGAWKIFPKHEQVKLSHHLEKLMSYYSGVLPLKRPPQALFIIDVRKEVAAVREAVRVKIPIIGIVDTNSSPKDVTYIIPANDDAVGSIQIIVDYLTEAYAEGLKLREAQETPDSKPAPVPAATKATEEKKPAEPKNKPVKAETQTKEVKPPAADAPEATKKRGRPKKTV